MSQRAWLLVEWVDESDMTPSYGIVNIESLCYQESDLQPGKKIFISLKLNEPRQALIIQISDSKTQVQQQKQILERQDQQVKNVLQLCMRTLKEIKTDKYSGFVENGIPNSNTNQHNIVPFITAHSENSASDNDSEHNEIVHHQHRSRASKSSGKRGRPSQTQRIKSDYEYYHSQNQSAHNLVDHRRRSVISSTPLPTPVNRQEDIKLCFDQGTQTDNTLLQPPLAKIEEMESVLKQLYRRFQALVMKVNNSNASIDMSESEQHDVSYPEPMPMYNEAWVPNTVTERVQLRDTLNGDNVQEVSEDHAIKNLDVESTVNVKMEGDRPVNFDNSTRVRRMSAQTTETEMISIGDGNALVPQRLLNDIDWSSYTTATRQLLQASFSRKVLATHSLTGKQSPAHLHKPPKKLLDPKLVDDIVKTVSVRCGVPKNLVRNSITVKCTDEAKLYRNRQRNRQAQAGIQNDENVPPPIAPSSDESANIIS